ncbi:MAG: beta-N-acetylglucosaminidase domain-containing protein [Pseudomonadales bacterium]|jgi:hypothetical protein|nr:beta-N-acetylglucosaminidase domain-containing protein [Pseudomonadales bacterium]
MTDFRGYPFGVIEGYFGPQWSWACRHDYAGFLCAQGFNTYVYAPKNDAYLRKAWQELHPEPEFRHLLALRAHYRRAGVAFGIGLSPFELYRDFSQDKQRLLAHKLEQLHALELDLLCILFDDMLGSLADLAVQQLRIIEFITERSNAKRYAVCPTYYSDDPFLTRHFGAAPAHYLQALGAGLDPAHWLFWTGQYAISPSYPAAHLQDVGARLRRKPLLWDNYPVNDAKRLTPFLHLAPGTGREPATLRAHTGGQLCNPMNQGYLSQLPLYALARHYRSNTATTLNDALHALCSPALAMLLTRDAARFQQQGLEALDAATRMMLAEEYAALHEEAMAQEVSAWLRGAYTFDPACLT